MSLDPSSGLYVVNVASSRRERYLDHNRLELLTAPASGAELVGWRCRFTDVYHQHGQYLGEISGYDAVADLHTVSYRCNISKQVDLTQRDVKYIVTPEVAPAVARLVRNASTVADLPPRGKRARTETDVAQAMLPAPSRPRSERAMAKPTWTKAYATNGSDLHLTGSPAAAQLWQPASTSSPHTHPGSGLKDPRRPPQKVSAQPAPQPLQQPLPAKRLKTLNAAEASSGQRADMLLPPHRPAPAGTAAQRAAVALGKVDRPPLVGLRLRDFPDSYVGDCFAEGMRADWIEGGLGSLGNK